MKYNHAAIFGGMIVLFLLEGFIPRRTTEANQTNRWLSNISLAIFNHFFILFFSVILFGVIAKTQPESPLLHAFGASNIISFVIVLLVMEFVNYWVHRAFHRFPILWRIHAVHHTDTEIDVTTSHRHHPFESILSLLIGLPVVIALGAPIITLIIYPKKA